MTQYQIKQKPKPIRAHRIVSMDANDLPPWAQEAQNSEEIIVYYPKYSPLPLGHIPFSDDSPGAADWII